MTHPALAQPSRTTAQAAAQKEFVQAGKLYAKGQLAAARDILERLLARYPTHTDSLTNLAAIACKMGDMAKGLDYALRAVKLAPTNAIFMRNVGQILFDMGQGAPAVEAFRIASQLGPNDAKSHSVYGIALRHLERWDEATAASLRAIELDPSMADAFDNLAITLIVQRDYDTALKLFNEAVRLAPNSPQAWNNLGSSLGAIGGRTAEAAEALRRAIALNPKQSASRMNLGMAMLKLGDFENGWREYEHRWDVGAMQLVRRPKSLKWWDGSAAPGTILLHAEQGLGDTLQFCRYAPIVAARGHKIVLEVQPEVLDLVTDSVGSDDVAVVARGKAYPGLDGLPPVDAHCPLMSIPGILGTRMDNIPGDTYLRADPAKVEAWRERFAVFGDGLRVGLVWAGSPRRDASIAIRQTDARRSTTLASFAPVLAIPGVHFVSLQKGEGLDELRQPRYAEIYDADPHLRSFADTAAAVANLDLVICVDTSISHLVGGMGKPVWMMSRYDGCFRWLEEGQETPWYPSMRIFRQGADRGWGPVIAELADALAGTAAAAAPRLAAE